MLAKAVGAEFGVNEDTVLRWWHRGLPTGQKIPDEYHRRRGSFVHLFHPIIIDFIREQQALLDQVLPEHPALPELPIEQWLTTAQLAAHFGGLDAQSAYRWLGQGIIPESYIKKCGKRRRKFHPAVIPVLEKIFAASHSKPAAARAQPIRAASAE
jgi:hypothetical protein